MFYIRKKQSLKMKETKISETNNMPIGCKTIEKRITSNDYKAQYYWLYIFSGIYSKNKHTVNKSYAWI